MIKQEPCKTLVQATGEKIKQKMHYQQKSNIFIETKQTFSRLLKPELYINSVIKCCKNVTKLSCVVFVSFLAHVQSLDGSIKTLIVRILIEWISKKQNINANYKLCFLYVSTFICFFLRLFAVVVLVTHLLCE